ncbi:MAG: hypothetical protein M3P18_17100, partial [Actinomycetota bacterium]|nr:hypothetical protein [Actinomycetota bacterium]
GYGCLLLAFLTTSRLHPVAFDVILLDTASGLYPVAFDVILLNTASGLDPVAFDVVVYLSGRSNPMSLDVSL